MQRIPSLDGLRAISILMVLYGHLISTRGFPLIHRGFGLAESGVRVFFIISGFLITNLLLRELDSVLASFATRADPNRLGNRSRAAIAGLAEGVTRYCREGAA